MFIEFVNQNIWWFLAFGLVFNLWLFSFMQGRVNGANMVSALELPALQRTGKSVIIDVSKADHYVASHIPNSLNFPVEEINSDNKALLKHKNSTTIVVCQTGSRSNTAAKQLVEAGFSNINVLRGGMAAWTKENLPTTNSSELNTPKKSN